jgi:hypothetical protein
MLTPWRLTIRLFLFTNRHGVTFINTWESHISQVHSLICAALLQCCRHNTWGKVIWTCWRYFVKRHKDVKTKSYMLWRRIVTPVWSAGCERHAAVQLYGFPRSCRYIFPTSDVNTTATGNRQKFSILQFSDYSLRTAASFLSLETICTILMIYLCFPSHIFNYRTSFMTEFVWCSNLVKPSSGLRILFELARTFGAPFV